MEHFEKLTDWKFSREFQLNFSVCIYGELIFSTLSVSIVTFHVNEIIQIIIIQYQFVPLTLNLYLNSQLFLFIIFFVLLDSLDNEYFIVKSDMKKETFFLKNKFNYFQSTTLVCTCCAIISYCGSGWERGKSYGDVAILRQAVNECPKIKDCRPHKGLFATWWISERLHEDRQKNRSRSPKTEDPTSKWLPCENIIKIINLGILTNDKHKNLLMTKDCNHRKWKLLR